LLGDAEWQVMGAPGHTAGHLSLWQTPCPTATSDGSTSPSTGPMPPRPRWHPCGGWPTSNHGCCFRRTGRSVPIQRSLSQPGCARPIASSMTRPALSVTGRAGR
jgi:hypothetical protein